MIPEDTWFRFPEKDLKLLPKKIPQFLKIYGKFLSASVKKLDESCINPVRENERKRVNVQGNSIVDTWVVLLQLYPSLRLAKQPSYTKDSALNRKPTFTLWNIKDWCRRKYLPFAI
nr:DUF1564 family protein [Leptospira weilii]